MCGVSRHCVYMYIVRVYRANYVMEPKCNYGADRATLLWRGSVGGWLGARPGGRVCEPGMCVKRNGSGARRWRVYDCVVTSASLSATLKRAPASQPAIIVLTVQQRIVTTWCQGAPLETYTCVCV